MHSIFNCIFMEMSFFSAHRQASKAKKNYNKKKKKKKKKKKIAEIHWNSRNIPVHSDI